MRILGLRLLVIVLMILLPVEPFPIYPRHPGGSDLAALRTPGRSPGEVPATTQQRVQQSFGRLPLYFVENRGQVDTRVAYYLQSGRTTVYFTPEGLTYAFITKSHDVARGTDPRSFFRPAIAFGSEPREPAWQRWALKVDFVGANSDVRISARDRTPTIVSYFKGPRDQWKTGLKTYSTITYENLWPGIDLVYSAASQLKYTFVVRPGADPNQIRLAYRGATGVRLNEQGQLEVATPLGKLTDDKPYSYQEAAGLRQEVSTAFAMEPGTATDGHVYRFRVGTYDTQRPLVIDPTVLVYAGYIGGAPSGDPAQPAEDIAIDAAGNAYVTGRTSSDELNFPVTVGPDLTSNGGGDAFVAKVNAAGTALVYAGYIGGGSTGGSGIAVDGDGNAYVTGSTTADETTFPVIGGPDLTANGNSDAFLVKVNSAGTGLIYAGFIGGFDDDSGTDVAVDRTGNAYVTGLTFSSETRGFPVAVGPSLVYQGSFEAFVAKVDPLGQGLVYAGYIGSDGNDIGRGVAVDSFGNVYVAGQTDADHTRFPVTVGPDLTFSGGGFIAKVRADGTGLDYAGYVGGLAHGVAVDGSGAAYVTGLTGSGLVVTVGPDLTFGGGVLDAFIAKVRPDGTGFVYAGYIGGAGWDEGRGVAVDGAGNVYVTGLTASTEATFPVAAAPDITFNGGQYDGFVVKVNVAGTAFDYAGYIGGDQSDEGHRIAVDTAGNAYVAGVTESAQATFPEMVGPDLTLSGFQDAFVAKLSTVIVVAIDIKPGNFPNALPDIDPLNLSSNGNTPVAIFTTPDFDAATMAPGTVAFAGAPAIRSALEDVDHDGDLDMVLHFETDQLNLNCSSTEANLTGQTTGGTPILGTDMVRIIKDKNKVLCP